MALIPLAPETIRLNGDPVKWSLTKVFNSCREVATTAYLSLPLVGACALHQNAANSSPIEVVASVAAGVAIDSTMYRGLIEKLRLGRHFGSKMNDLYIVKDNRFAQTSPENYSKALQTLHGARINLMFQSVMASMLGGGAIGYSIMSAAGQVPVSAPAAFFSALFLNGVFNEASTLRRFSKVVKGDWIITDTPKQETQDDKFSLPDWLKPRQELQPSAG